MDADNFEQFTTVNSINLKHDDKKPIFTVDLESELRKPRSIKVKQNGIFYASVDLDGKRSPLQLSPVHTSAGVHDATLTQKDRKELRQGTFNREKKVPNAVIVQITADFLDESEDQIMTRAKAIVKEFAPHLVESTDQYDRIINGEIAKILEKKKLSMAFKHIDDYFHKWLKLKKTRRELKNTEVQDQGATCRGPIQYERRLSDDENSKLEGELKDEDDDEEENEAESLDKKIALARKKLNVTINPKTGLIVLDGSEEAGSPIIRFHIGLNASNKQLYIDLYDITKGITRDKRTGEDIYTPAIVNKKSSSGKMIPHPVDYDTISEFITPGSLIVGMIGFRLTISPKAISLKASLTNQLFVRKAKPQRKKKVIDKKTVSRVFDYGDDYRYGDAETDENVNEEVESSTDNEIKNAEDEEDNDSDDTYVKNEEIAVDRY